MPDISAYRNAAASGYTGALALDAQAQIIKASKNASVTGLGRFFNTRACQRMSQAVLNDFKQALVAAYGAGTAAQALEGTLGGNVYETLWPREGAAARHAKIPKFTVDKLKEALRNADLAVFDGFGAAGEVRNRATNRLNELLVQEPLSDQERDDLIDKLETAKSRLEENGLEAADNGALHFRIRQRLVDLRARHLSRPTNGDVRKTVDRWIACGRTALERQLDNAQGISPDVRLALLAAYERDVQTDLTNRLAGSPDAGAAFAFSKATFTKDELKNFCGLVCERTKASVKRHLASLPRATRPDFHFSDSAFRAAIKAERHRSVNADATSWNTIAKNFTVKMDGQELRLTSTLTPARRIANNQNVYGADEIGGVNCHDSSNPHVVNCWSTELQVNGRRVCSAHRSATLSAYGCGDPRVRQRNGINRAVEYVKTIFRSREDLQAIVELARQDNRRTVEVPFDVVSIGLLTPALVGSGGERGMVDDQFRIWDAINAMALTDSDKLEINEGGMTIRLKPNVLSLNLGVNTAALNYHLPDSFAGWGMANERNGRAIDEVLGWVPDQLTKLENQGGEANQAKIRAILTLHRQIAAMRADPSAYKRESGEAYKLASRLTLLTDLLGKSAIFNCKSGKDRTGVNDTEYKFLATLAALGKPIPEPGAELTNEQQALYRAIMLQGGNLEVQRDNTGFEGYKAVTDMASTQNRMGADYVPAMKKASGVVSK